MSTPARRKPAATVPAPVEFKPEIDTFIGIDPGITGGIAVVYDDHTRPWVRPTPTMKDRKGRVVFDRERMAGVLAVWSNAFVVIERVNAAPMHKRRQGTGSMFSFGAGYGLWLGILTAQGKRFTEVYPQTWKARMLKGLGGGKEASIAFARAVDPFVSLRRTERSRKDDHGMADALCLARYAQSEWATMQAILVGSGSFR
jgi:hypothetical protein